MVNNSTNVNKTNNYQEPRIIEHNIDHGIWNLNSRSWFGTGTHIWWCSGADPGFQVRGGALKKVAPSRGRREHCWGISCEKSRFYAKKIIFSPILGGARAACAPPPPESAPGVKQVNGFPIPIPPLPAIKI